jgi:glycosyltransferase involved in cell wall biosynthesis
MLVSAVCPTRNRREFVAKAVACFLAQDYKKKQLIIVDNGDEPLRDLGPRNWVRSDVYERVMYIRVEGARKSVGAMRNIGCAAAAGDLICAWDDDDYSHPRRISEQVKLIVMSQTNMVGYNSMPFIDEENRKAYLYRNPEMYALGTSLMYQRAYWRGRKFPEIDVGEDNEFIERAQRARSLIAVDAGDRMVARIHSGNTCAKLAIPPMWTPVDYGVVEHMLNPMVQMANAT